MVLNSNSYLQNKLEHIAEVHILFNSLDKLHIVWKKIVVMEEILHIIQLWSYSSVDCGILIASQLTISWRDEGYHEDSSYVSTSAIVPLIKSTDYARFNYASL